MACSTDGNNRADFIILGPKPGAVSFDKPGRHKGFDVFMDALVVPSDASGERGNACRRLPVQMAQQFKSFRSHDSRQRLPGDECQIVLAEMLPAFSPPPGIRNTARNRVKSAADLYIKFVAHFISLFLCRMAVSNQFLSQPFHVNSKVLQQPLDRNETVGLLPAAQVPVIALAAFIVIANQPITVPPILQRIFEPMPGRAHRFGNPPNTNLEDRAIFENHPLTDQQLGIHMA